MRSSPILVLRTTSKKRKTISWRRGVEGLVTQPPNSSSLKAHTLVVRLMSGLVASSYMQCLLATFRFKMTISAYSTCVSPALRLPSPITSPWRCGIFSASCWCPIRNTVQHWNKSWHIRGLFHSSLSSDNLCTISNVPCKLSNKKINSDIRRGSANVPSSTAPLISKVPMAHRPCLRGLSPLQTTSQQLSLHIDFSSIVIRHALNSNNRFPLVRHQHVFAPVPRLALAPLL